MKTILITPIGTVRSTRKIIEDDHWDHEQVHVELDSSQFSAEAFLGLSEFSHVEILFSMDQVDPEKIEKAARHPRGLMQGYWA